MQKELQINFMDMVVMKLISGLTLYVIPQMKEKYDIKVKRVGMNIDDIMNKLLSEKQAKSKDG